MPNERSIGGSGQNYLNYLAVKAIAFKDALRDCELQLETEVKKQRSQRRSNNGGRFGKVDGRGRNNAKERAEESSRSEACSELRQMQLKGMAEGATTTMNLRYGGDDSIHKFEVWTPNCDAAALLSPLIINKGQHQKVLNVHWMKNMQKKLMETDDIEIFEAVPPSRRPAYDYMNMIIGEGPREWQTKCWGAIDEIKVIEYCDEHQWWEPAISTSSVDGDYFADDNVIVDFDNDGDEGQAAAAAIAAVAALEAAVTEAETNAETNAEAERANYLPRETEGSRTLARYAEDMPRYAEVVARYSESRKSDYL
eukprot:Seg1956.11 transcript_id=Seg1956.11/GoldUCD/mRNA.D3Y31 product="hypothetical protein" protein_id=Seg1956.11/GoldUCD/D3Y31